MEARNFFRERLEEENQRAPDGFVEFLEVLTRKINKLQLMEYIVGFDSDAIRMFETVNDRGRPLSNLEKTKSFLMHTSYLGMAEDNSAIDARLAKLNDYFAGIYKWYEDVAVTERFQWLGSTGIQQYHYITYISHVQRDVNRYMDALKDLIRDKFRNDSDECVQYALDYARDLERAFFAVKEIAEMRGGENGRLGYHLDKLITVDRLGNVFPLLMASWQKFKDEPERLTKIVRLLEAFTFRTYAIAKYRSDYRGTHMRRLASQIRQDLMSYDDLIIYLTRFFVDRDFERDLRSENLYSRHSSRDMKYLLSEYEIHIRQSSGEPLHLAQEEILSTEYQVEHIWPQSASNLGLNRDGLEAHARNADRLGNLTIASKSWNISMGNKPFEEKVLKYGESSLRVQRELANFSEWGPEAIREREDKIVEFALKRWSV